MTILNIYKLVFLLLSFSNAQKTFISNNYQPNIIEEKIFADEKVLEYSWNEMHETASKNPYQFIDLVKEYKKSFPCEECRKNFRKEVRYMEKIFPLKNIESIEDSKLWAWIVHNSVNIRLGKAWFPYQILIKYENRESR